MNYESLIFIKLFFCLPGLWLESRVLLIASKTSSAHILSFSRTSLVTFLFLSGCVCSASSIPTSHLPFLFPAEFQIISALLMGRQCNERRKGLCLLTSVDVFYSSTTAIREFFHWIIEKLIKGNIAHTCIHRKPYVLYSVCALLCAKESMG